MQDKLPEETLAHILVNKLEASKELKEDVAHYWRQKVGHPDRSYNYLRGIMNVCSNAVSKSRAVMRNLPSCRVTTNVTVLLPKVKPPRPLVASAEASATSPRAKTKGQG